MQDTYIHTSLQQTRDGAAIATMNTYYMTAITLPSLHTMYRLAFLQKLV